MTPPTDRPTHRIAPAELPARQDSLVGVDSDGCVFDSMEVKQREHFHPLIIRFWELERIEPYLRAAAEFVNLRSQWRGRNRFPNLLLTFELLHAWDEVRRTGVQLPALDALRAYCNSGLSLGDPSLKTEVARTGDPELRRLYDWSRAINADIDVRMRPVPPFRWAVKALARIHTHSDALVVSQTPAQALIKEWHQHGLARYVALIAGQERGTKAQQLQDAAAARYAAGRILMIGDAPADWAAAREIGALFYPIPPGDEEAAWERFCTEAYDRFLAGTLAGPYADGLLAAFNAALPATPPWATGRG